MVARLKSHQIYLKMCTIINLKALATNLTGSSFTQNLFLLLCAIFSELINLYPRFPMKSSKNHKIIFTKRSIVHVWEGSEYAMNIVAKYLQDNYWWALESIEMKGCIGMERVMPRLNTHVFISLYSINFLCLIFQARRHFFHSDHHSFYRYFHCRK